jgi:hypothetical protein
MKTKDFIKMLQEADPGGEAYIRMEGGVPFAIELKPGYYDGPYSFIDDGENWITSARNNKVDIHCTDVKEWAFNHFEAGKSLEEIRSKVLFELEIYVNEREDLKERIFDRVEKAYEDFLEVEKRWKEMNKKSQI